MIGLSKDMHTLASFKRKASEWMVRLKRSGRPLVLTVNGRAELVVQDAASYQRLLEQAERAEMMEFLRESWGDIAAGRTEPAVAALERLGKRHKLKQQSK
jgi:PHD/YefM family antitoxin component YafN of YafNO toxin-antitoxin module